MQVRLPGRTAIRLKVQDQASAVDIPARGASCVPLPLVGQIAAGVRQVAGQVMADAFVIEDTFAGREQEMTPPFPARWFPCYAASEGERPGRREASGIFHER